jgi:putative ABC transport system permease protein
MRGLTGRADLWIPAAMASSVSYPEYRTTNQNFISVVGRLRAGRTVADARAALDVIGARIETARPSAAYEAGEHLAATVVALDAARIDPVGRQSALFLLDAVGFLLLLACANVANLLLARAGARRRQLVIRAALGASRARLAREILTESAILTVAGGALGTLLAAWVLPALPVTSAVIGPRNMYGSLGAFAEPRFDLRVLLFVVGVTALAAFLCGTLPALQPSRLDLARDLREGAPALGGRVGRRRLTMRSAIVAAETALALVLLVTAGLMLESYRRLRAAEIGFEPRGLVTFWLLPPDVRYPPPRAALLIERVLAEIALIPGVEAATVDGCTPLDTGCANSTLYVVGRPKPKPSEAPGVLRHYVGPEHFRTLRVPLVRGRVFQASDRAGSPRVAVINELAARRFFPNEDPIGRRVWFGGGSNFDRPDSAAEIVGIVGDVAYQALDERPVQPDFYTPYQQFTYAARAVLVRARDGEPARLVPALRRAVRTVDPALALHDVRTMEDRIGSTWARRRLQTALLTGFALVAILLAAMGIYAVVAHTVTQRTREVGIRIALGATAADVVALLVRQGMALPLVGLVAGIGASLLFTRALAAMLYGVSATDPVVFAAVTLLLAAVALAACYVPARRVVRLDPLAALKTDA